jgi:hypothetical protein
MNRQFWLARLLVLVHPFAGTGAGALILGTLGVGREDYSDVLINLVFLIACVGLVRGLRLSATDIGLSVIKERLAWHVSVCLSLFCVYMLYYLGISPRKNRDD